ncbi:MAG: AAA family ATPase [Pseudolysinimonas sp.]
MPRRIAIAGVSGAGKSTFAARLADRHELRYQELDELHHGPGWSVLPDFVDKVERLTAEPAWVTEWQYHQVRTMIAERADTLIWLDYPISLVMARVIRRTVRRSLRREELWNGNVEPPLRTFFTDRNHIIRWAWRTRRHWTAEVSRIAGLRPELRVIRLADPAAARRYLGDPRH